MKTFKDLRAQFSNNDAHDYDIMEEEQYAEFLSEGVNDPGIFKAVFMAGGPGSGKSFIAGKTGLTSMGLRVINSDDIFEANLKKAGLEATPENIFTEKGQSIRATSKALTDKKQEISLNGRLGLLVDGTGKEVEKIKYQKAGLERLGYDTMMIFVNTTLETSISRDKARARSVGSKAVTQMWSKVQENIGAFQRLFGRKRFVIVDNTEGKDFNKETMSAYKVATKFIKSKPSNIIAKRWVKAELKRRNITSFKERK